MQRIKKQRSFKWKISKALQITYAFEICFFYFSLPRRDWFFVFILWILASWFLGLSLKENLPVNREIYYVDGLVSTGKFISLHNIKYNFFYIKKNLKEFYSHLGICLWKRMMVYIVYGFSFIVLKFKETWLNTVTLIIKSVTPKNEKRKTTNEKLSIRLKR